MSVMSGIENEDSLGVVSKPRLKRRKPGIIYLSSIPPSFSVLRIRQYFSKFGQVDKIYLQPINDQSIKKSRGKMSKRPQFSEGWIEFKSKRKAKMVYSFVNNQPAGGKKSNPDYDFLWNIKYLPRFKWAYLKQRLEYESQIRSKRMKTEISQVNKLVDHYIRATEISKRIGKNKNKEAEENSETKIGKTSFVFKQKLTEEEILKKKEFKKLKNEIYRKNLIENKKMKKKKYKDKKVMKPDDLLSSVFVGSGS